MSRSEAQKAADKRYATKIKDNYKSFAVNFKVDEYEEITREIAERGFTKADFIRWAINELKKAK